MEAPSEGRPISPPPIARAERPAKVAETAPLADVAPAARKMQPLDINRLSEHWDDVIEAVRATGRGVIASALAEGTPVAVTAQGVITVGVSSDAIASALEANQAPILAAVRSIFDGASKIAIKMAGETRGSRLTADDVIANRVMMLRKRDPVLDAAVELLDLRLID